MADGFFLDDLQFGVPDPDSEREVTLVMITTGLSLGEALGEWLSDFVEELPPSAQFVFDENYEQHTREFTNVVVDALENYVEGLKSKLLVEAQRREALGG